MHFQRLTSDRDALFEEAFKLYSVSFPEHEQRSLSKQRALMGNGLYHFDAIMDGDTFAGIVLYWVFDAYTYIEHFAIRQDLRGRALGSESLRLFNADHELVILEIDPPTDPVAIRRESFYRKLGFRTNPFSHAHPSYRKRFPPHHLVVMSLPRELAEREYAQFARELADVVMADVK